MKNPLSFSVLLLFFLQFLSASAYAQCTEAKDADMAKYKQLTETQDAQGCSQCAALAMYFCSARNTVAVEDKRVVSSLITQSKRNIVNMGQPYCCPELVNHEPQWGIDVEGNSSPGTITADDATVPANINNGSTSGKSSPTATNNAAAVEEVLNAAAPLIEQWASNREKRWVEEQRRQEEIEDQKAELVKLNQQKAEEYFNEKYLKKYLKAANEGDEKARLLLRTKLQLVSYACAEASSGSGEYEACDIYHLLPDSQKWFEEAIKNNNLYAMTASGAYITAENEAAQIALLEKAAGLGSLDAMIILGDFYDKKSTRESEYSLHGGNDPQKALYWYNKAAEAGCPKGMYLLGMINKYKASRLNYKGKVDKKSNVVYDIKVDNFKAFEWFTKSVLVENHEVSMYAENDRESTAIFGLPSRWVSASIFDYEAYKELSHMYENGIGVDKNVEIARELLDAYTTWKNKYYTTEEF